MPIIKNKNSQTVNQAQTTPVKKKVILKKSVAAPTASPTTSVAAPPPEGKKERAKRGTGQKTLTNKEAREIVAHYLLDLLSGDGTPDLGSLLLQKSESVLYNEANMEKMIAAWLRATNPLRTDAGTPRAGESTMDPYREEWATRKLAASKEA